MALVTELKKERRHGLLLGAIGVGIAAILIVVYFSQAGGGDEPSSPAGRAATQAREGPKPPTFGVPGGTSNVGLGAAPVLPTAPRSLASSSPSL